MHTLIDQYSFVIPIIVRAGIRAAAVLAVPLGHHIYHKLAHAGIHSAQHKIGVLGKLTKRFSWIPDLLMLGALVVLHVVTEHDETGEHSEHSEIDESTGSKKE